MGRCTFNKSWLQSDEFKEWLEENKKSVHKFGCKLCRKHDLSLSDTGIASLRRHVKSKKHQDITTAEATNGNFFQSKKRKAPEKVVDLTSGTIESLPKKVAVMECTKTAETKAEILWTLNCVMENSSCRSNDDKALLFRTMFPDSDIARKFTLGRTKYLYYLNEGIAEYLKDDLDALILKSSHFTASYDESMNDVLQKCQMDILIKCWDSEKEEAVTRYYSSKFLGHATATILLSTFLSAISKLDADKMTQCSMDGPKVNLLFYKNLVASRKKDEKKGLIDLGTCNLHVVHGAVKTGVNSTGWKVKEGLSASHNLLHDSPARREDYIMQTGSSTFPLPPAWTRWTEDVPVSRRLIDIWSNIVELVRYYERFSPSKRPKCKSYGVVVEQSADKLKVCELHFYAFFSEKFRPFLTFYQSDKPLAPFLYGDLLKMIRDLMSLVFKDTSLDLVKSLADFRKFNLDDKTHLLKRQQFSIGTGTSNTLKHLVRFGDISAVEEDKFKKQ